MKALTMLAAFWGWLIQTAEAWNLLFAIAITVVGVSLWAIKPEPLRSHPHIRAALDFWIGSWVCLILVYGFRTALTGVPQWLQFFLVDLQTILTFAFCVAFVETKKVAVGRAWVAILVIAVIIAGYEVLLSTAATSGPGNLIWRFIWIIPSAFLGLVSMTALGSVFLLRYGWHALPIVVVGVLYGAAQWPVYTSVIIEVAPDGRWFLALALGKLLLGYLFYLYFLAPLPDYSPLQLFRSDAAACAVIRRRLKTFAAIAGSIVLMLAGSLLGAALT